MPANSSASSGLGKEQHIARVTTDLYNQTRAIIQTHEILLIDDDLDNVTIARSFGHWAFEVKETVTMEDITAFVDSMHDDSSDQTLPVGVTVIPDTAIPVIANAAPLAETTAVQTRGASTFELPRPKLHGVDQALIDAYVRERCWEKEVPLYTAQRPSHAAQRESGKQAGGRGGELPRSGSERAVFVDPRPRGELSGNRRARSVCVMVVQDHS